MIKEISSDDFDKADVMGWMKKIIDVQDRMIAKKDEYIALLKEEIRLLEAGTPKKTVATVLQLVKK
jgi:hypothetical protein